MEEFLARVDPADGFQVATARCLPYGQTLTYWPLRGLLPIRCVGIIEALGASDLARLVTAIDEAEALGLIPHAARMRIVLAQRTGDQIQLECARTVLERLGDRQFLRRLEEVAASLGE